LVIQFCNEMPILLKTLILALFLSACTLVIEDPTIASSISLEHNENKKIKLRTFWANQMDEFGERSIKVDP
jgi:hypothetical protein